MKAISYLVTFCLVILALGNSNARESRVYWDDIGKNIAKSISSGDELRQQAAMQQIIQYSDKLDVSSSVFDILKIFRDNRNSGVRQLALITLYKTGDPRAAYFLRRNLPFEHDLKIKNLSYACLWDLMTSDRTAYWNEFKKALITGLKSNDQKLQEASMQSVIQYSDSLNLETAALDVLRIFRNSQSPGIRKLALIALNSIGEQRTMEFLASSVKYEKDDSVRNLCYACLDEYLETEAIAHVHRVFSSSTMAAGADSSGLN